MNQIVPPPSEPLIQNFSYQGKVSRLYGLYLKMGLLSLLTLGIYTFWGRTNLRRYLWSNVSLGDSRFAYSGTGTELLKSASKAVLLLFVPGLMINLLIVTLFNGQKDNPVIYGLEMAQAVLIYLLLAARGFMTIRYRLGRTSWRGIRFSLQGRLRDFIKLRIKNFFFNLFSLGLYRSIGDVAMLTFVINRAHFGSLSFTYKGQKEELQKTWFCCWLLLLPTLGLSMFWYRAKYWAHVAKYTQLGSMQFRVALSGGQYCRFAMLNFFLLLVTLGMAYPWIVQRRMRFMAKRVKLRGHIDFAAVAQANGEAGTEGMSLIFGADDFGF
jgi:uncharacterized membrane protein YjgN (DUF898 family)